MGMNKMGTSVLRAFAGFAAWSFMAAASHAQTTVPTLAEIVLEDFERGTLEDWGEAAGSVVSLQNGTGIGGSTALAVTVSQAESHIVRGGSRDLARADEAYLTFQFDPNNLSYVDPGSGFLPGRSIQFAAIKGPDFKNLVAIRFIDTGPGYDAYIEWRDGTDTAQFDFAAGSFSLDNDWQEITIGYRRNSWVAAWVDGVNVASVTGVTHFEPYGSVVEVGKTLTNTLINPSGLMRFDDVQFAVPRLENVWVNASGGNDNNSGLTQGNALRTIGRASDLAAAGTTVRILPGTYHETILPAQGGAAGDPVVYQAENGPGTVTIRGSERSGDLSWTQLTSNTIGLPPSVTPTNIWWTDLSSWNLTGAPLFVVRTSGGDVSERLPVAREPDWEVTTDYKPSEFWWEANGGGFVPGCTPSPADPNCDEAARSDMQLTDTTNDATAGIEPGNLTTLGNLTGATIVALDTFRGHFHYRRTITAHNVGAGRVTVDSPCRRTGGVDGLGWGSKYYVEAHPRLIDQAGEWWYDDSTSRLYLWPPSAGNPAAQNLEVSRHQDGFDLTDRSHVTLRDLDIELYNGSAVDNRNFISHLSLNNTVSGCRLAYANRGVDLFHQIEDGSHDNKRIEGFRIEDSEIMHIDSQSISSAYIWDNGSNADDWVRSGIFDTEIVGNTMTDIGFRVEPNADSTGGLSVRFPDRLTIEGNTMTNIGPDGILLVESVIQSNDTWGFAPGEIKVGEVLLRNNLVAGACTLKNDCGAIRVFGLAPDNHVYRDLLMIGNQFYDTHAWGWAAERRGVDVDGQIDGGSGSGIYLDNSSGLHAYRNRLYNNSLAGIFMIRTWRDGQVIITNNVIADNLFGIFYGGLGNDLDHVNVDTRVQNNAVVNNEGFGMRFADEDGDFTNTIINRNLYHANGWGNELVNPGVFLRVDTGALNAFPTLADLQAATPFEAAGQAGNPDFVDYDAGDHDPFDGSRPDFRIDEGSVAEDAGTTGLPASLTALLTLFNIPDTLIGPRYDQGAFEGTVSVPGGLLFGDGFESGNTSAWSQTVP